MWNLSLRLLNTRLGTSVQCFDCPFWYHSAQKTVTWRGRHARKAFELLEVGRLKVDERWWNFQGVPRPPFSGKGGRDPLTLPSEHASMPNPAFARAPWIRKKEQTAITSCMGCVRCHRPSYVWWAGGTSFLWLKEPLQPPHYECGWCAHLRTWGGGSTWCSGRSSGSPGEGKGAWGLLKVSANFINLHFLKKLYLRPLDWASSILQSSEHWSAKMGTHNVKYLFSIWCLLLSTTILRWPILP